MASQLVSEAIISLIVASSAALVILGISII